MSTNITYCRNCAAMCGLKVSTEGGKIVDIRGDREHDLSSGYFCIKGMATLGFHNGEDRLLNSLRRDAYGSFEPVDIEEALDEIQERLSDIIARYGPQSVAVYYGTGANCNVLSVPAAKAWAEAVGTPYIFSSMTLDQSAKWVTASRMGVFATGKHQAPDIDALMIVGSNPAASHAFYGLPGSNSARQARVAQKAGMKLIVVDPRKTEIARSADLHLPVRPGQDATLFAGLIRMIFDKDRVDKTFCDRFTQSLDHLRNAVDDFTLEYVSDRTGVSVDDLEEAVRIFTSAKRASVASGTGPNMSLNSNLAEHLIEAFNAICGGYRRAGDLVRNTGYFQSLFASKEMVIPPNRTWERGPKLKTVDIGPLAGEYPTSMLPSEIQGNDEGRIRALIQVGGNLIKALPEPDKSIPIFAELDLFVSLDVRETTTARLADYQIATSAHYEHHDLNSGMEYMMPTTFVQMAKPFLQRPEGVIDDWQFFRDLALRMGKTLKMRRPLFGVAHRDIPGPEISLTPDKSAEDLIRWMADMGLSSYEELEAHPSGIQFESAEKIIEPADPDADAKLDLCPLDIAGEIRNLRSTEDEVAGFPFRLINRRMIDVMNSAYTEASQTRQRYPTNPIFMNGEDMASLAIENSAQVKLISRTQGVVVGRVQKDSGLRRGVISMCHGWGNPELSGRDDPDAFSGRLVSLDQDLESINFMPRQSSVPVNVERYKGP